MIDRQMTWIDRKGKASKRREALEQQAFLALGTIFMEDHFYLKEGWKEDYGFSNLSIWQTFLRNDHSKRVTSRKNN